MWRMRYFLLIIAVVMGQSLLAADKKPPSPGKYQLILKRIHI
jgi:hypothetical protein